MRLPDLYLLVACCTLGSITGVSSIAPPRSYSDFRLERRKDVFTPESEVDAAAGTGKLRECKLLNHQQQQRPISLSLKCSFTRNSHRTFLKPVVLT